MAIELPVPAGWHRVRLSDMGEVNRGRSRHRPRHEPRLYGGPYPFIQTGDIKASLGRIRSFSQTYSEEGLAQSRLWPGGTMCITIAANIAETAILSFPACFPDSVIGFIGDETKCDVRFIEYMFRQLRRLIQHEIEGSGTVQDNINLAYLEHLWFPVPDLHLQRQIADTLSVIDDKIDLNADLSKALESLATALFRSWFIDFDPVVAKRDGRTPTAVPAEAMDLFPNHFAESDLGPIPRGWSVRPLSGLLRSQIGGVWGEDVRSDEASVSAISLRGIDCHALAECDIPDVKARWFSERQLRDRTLSGGELLIEGSGSFCGRSLLVDKATLALFSESVTYSNFCKRFDAMECSAHGVLAWFALREEYRGGSLDAYRTGSAFPNFDAEGALDNIKLALPDNPLPTLFERLWKNFRDQQVTSMDESRTLVTLRDGLLGPLLSGELTINFAEKAVGVAL